MPKTNQASVAFMSWNLDTRVVARNLHDGVINEAEYQAFLAKLPDVAAKAEPVRTSLPGGDVDDLDDD